MKKIFIIILNYNGWKDTEECLEFLFKLSTTNYQLQIVVVDNGSSENFKFQISPSFIGASNFKLIRNKTNLGFAGGNNVGIRYALENEADYLMILNNDTIVDKNLVNELLKTIEKDDSIGIVGPKIYFYPGNEYHHDRYKENERGKVIWYAGGLMDWENVIGSHRGVDEVDNGQYDLAEKTDFATGCAMFIKKEVFEKVGLLDSQYYLYYEDSDFSQRVKRFGYKIFYCPKGVVWHKNAGSSGGSGSTLQDYYTTRNRLLFGFKYAPLRTKLALLRESVRLFFSGRHWQKKGVIDFYLGKFGRGSYVV